MQPNYLFFAYFKELHLVRVQSIEENEEQEDGLRQSIAEVDGESEQSAPEVQPEKGLVPEVDPNEITQKVQIQRPIEVEEKKCSFVSGTDS